MDRPWMSADLGEALVRDDDLIARVPSIIADLTSGNINIATLVEHMASALTHKDYMCRERGVRFLNSVLMNLPVDFLTPHQLKFISNFYSDRLRDHHSVVPAVFEGFLTLIRMTGMRGAYVAQFLDCLFREISCQAQIKTDRTNLFHIMQHFLNSFPKEAKSMGDTLICGIITAIEGEREPTNLLLTLKLAQTLCQVCPPAPDSNLSEELLDVLSCYFPVDYTPPSNDSCRVTRKDIAKALAKAMMALPQFAEHCLLLLVEKLDSSLRLAKIDSLQLLEQSFSTFNLESYTPFLKSLWGAIQRETCQKNDKELNKTAHSALRALVEKLSTDKEKLESFLNPILSGLQGALTTADSVANFTQASEVFLTCARASPASCVLVANFTVSLVVSLISIQQERAKLQNVALTFLGDLYVISENFNIKLEQESLIPMVCVECDFPDVINKLTALDVLSMTAGALPPDHVPRLVDRLIWDSLHQSEDKLRKSSITCLRILSVVHPELVPHQKLKESLCELGDDVLRRSIPVWSSLSCVDSYTNLAMQRLLQLSRGAELMTTVAGALAECVSEESVCSATKVRQLSTECGLVDAILAWLCDETSKLAAPSALAQGYLLIAAVMRRLPSEDQARLLARHSGVVLDLCEQTLTNVLIAEALCNSLRPDVGSDEFPRAALTATRAALLSPHDLVRHRAAVLLAHLLNKLESVALETVYRVYVETLASVEITDEVRQRHYALFAWVTKSLLLRNDRRFHLWFSKIVEALGNEEVCDAAACSFEILMSSKNDSLSKYCHCRVSPLAAQRLMLAMLDAVPTSGRGRSQKRQRACLLSWAHVISGAPVTVVTRYIHKLAPLLLDSLTIQDESLLERALVAIKPAIEAKAFALQTLLPRLLKLIVYEDNMLMRMRSLECVHCAAESYPTAQLLPHKADALRALVVALDDRKRLVRAAAVRAASRWQLVGAPGEQTD